MADEGGALVAGGIGKIPSYTDGLGKNQCQEEFKKQMEVFVSNDVDFFMGEVIVYLIILFKYLKLKSTGRLF